MKLTHNNSGVAFVGMLGFFVVLAMFSAILVAQTVNEVRIVQDEREGGAAFYAAQAGSQAALKELDILINTHLQNTIAASSPSGVVSFSASSVSSGDGIGWLIASVRDNNVPVLLQNGEQAEYSQNNTLSNGAYTYEIIMTEKEDPSAAGTDAWDFPFSFHINSVGTSGDTSTNVSLNGDFTVRVQRDNFAKFALFTNEQETQGGSNVWFTDKTNFFGPVHTNERFNFALNPSGTFSEEISQNEITARFYNSGSPVLLDADYNGTNDVPTFLDTFERDAGTISFAGSTTEQDMADQAVGNENISSDGIYLPANGPNLSGGIYVQGDSSIQLSVDGNNNAVYTITQGSTTKEVIVNQSLQQTTLNDISAGTSNVYNGIPDGVDDAGTLIYVNGSITSLHGLVQGSTEATISSSSNVVFTDNLTYANYTAGSGTPGTPGYVPPTADGTDNLLGVISWGGNVSIGTSAPDDVQIHSTVMAQTGVFQVDNYNNQGVGSRGIATLLGGVITDNYGAFGLFNGSTGQQVAGYGRNFVYDNRMLAGKSPPYFPTLNTFLAFTNDITDKLIWQEGQ